VFSELQDQVAYLQVLRNGLDMSKYFGWAMNATVPTTAAWMFLFLLDMWKKIISSNLS
jgi:hypothetical protein